MHDPSMQEESVTLLGEEGLRSGGQALKLGYVIFIDINKYFKLFARCTIVKSRSILILCYMKIACMAKV